MIIKTRQLPAIDINADTLGQVVKKVTAAPAVNSHEVQMVCPGSKVTKVPHKLGRKPVSCHISRYNGTLSIGSLSFDDTYVYAYNTGSADIRIWVVVQ
jgi:hypothetical protein